MLRLQPYPLTSKTSYPLHPARALLPFKASQPTCRTQIIFLCCKGIWATQRDPIIGSLPQAVSSCGSVDREL